MRSVQETVKYGGGHIMYWGCMIADRVQFFCKIEGTLNATLYEKILNDEPMRSPEYHNREATNIMFQKDGDPKHTSKCDTNWFEKYEIKILDWLYQSPDLSPIEYLWKYIRIVSESRND